MNPAPTDAIYFMARPDHTGHVFSSNLAAHNRAVQNYRNAIAAAKAAEVTETAEQAN
jgi:cell division protein YceG involved in septum cleavage